MKHALFVYGSLLAPAVVGALLDRRVAMHAASLHGYRRIALRGRAYPGLIVDAGAVTVGAVIAVDAGELRLLDAYEAAEYQRIAVSVQMDDGSRRRAQTYLWTRRPLRPHGDGAWSPEQFVQRHSRRWAAAASAFRQRAGRR